MAKSLNIYNPDNSGSVDQAPKPSVLAVILECPNHAHGSGAVLEKSIAKNKINDIHFLYFYRNRIRETVFMTTQLRSSVFSKNNNSILQILKNTIRKRNLLYGTKAYQSYYQKIIAQTLILFNPDIVIGIVAEYKTARLFVWLARLFPEARLRLIIWDLIYDKDVSSTFHELSKVKNRIEIASVVSEPIKEDLKRYSGINASVNYPFVIEQPVRMMTFDQRKGVAMIGNIRTKNVFYCIETIGQILEFSLRDHPIFWFGGITFKENNMVPTTLWKHVTPEDYISADDYPNRIGKCLWGLIPFDVTPSPSSSYTKYSIPSRVADFISVGTPVLFIGGAESATGRLIEKYKIGVVLIQKDKSIAELLDTAVQNKNLWMEFHENCKIMCSELLKPGIQSILDNLIFQ